jgi:hypothetical protein
MLVSHKETQRKIPNSPSFIDKLDLIYRANMYSFVVLCWPCGIIYSCMFVQINLPA